MGGDSGFTPSLHFVVVLMVAEEEFHLEMRLQSVGLISPHLKDGVEEEVNFQQLSRLQGQRMSQFSLCVLF